MPRLAIPTIVAREQAGGTVRAPMPGGLDVRGLMAGAAAISDGAVRADINQQRIADELRLAQERKAEKLAHDEARLAATNALSAADSYWVEKLTTAQRDSAANAAGFTANVLKDWDQWAKQQEDQLPELAKPIVRQQLAAKKAQIHAQAFQFEVGQRDAAIRQGYADGAQQDVKTVGVAPAQFEARLAARIALARTLDLPEAERAKLIDATTESMAQAAAMGLVDRDAVGFLERAGVRSAKGPKGKQGGQQVDAADRVASDPILRHLTPQALRQTVDRASMIVAQQEAAAAQEQARRDAQAQAAAERRARAADQAWNVLSTSLMAGHQIDTSSPTNQALVAALNGSPYAAAYKEMLSESANRTAAALQPIPTQEAQLQSLYNRRNAAGTSPELDAEIKRREGVLNAARKEYTDDPLMAATRRGVITAPAPVQMANVDTMLSSIGPRLEQSDVVSSRTGRTESPLMPAEADALKTMFAGMTPDARGAAAFKIARTLGPEKAQALAKQMDEKDPVLSLALGTATQWTGRGRSVAELVFLGAQRFADTKTGRAGEKGDAVRQTMRSSMLEYLDGNTKGVASMPPKAREKLVEAAIYINAGLEASGSDSGPERAMRLAIGGDMIDHNGTRIPVPIEVGVEGFRERMSRYPRKLIEAQAGDGFVYSTGGRPKGVPEFLADLPFSSLQAAGHGLYYVKSGAGYAVNQKGRPILIEAR